MEKYDKGTHKKGPLFSLDDCHALIDFFKASIKKHKDWSQFGFDFSDTQTYEDLSGFYREVEQQGYKITFRNISSTYIDSLVEEGKIYLFKIYNKDFSPFSKGKPNLHTLYWKMLFDEKNLTDVVYKLNGKAEVFYRKKSIEYEKPTHSANVPIKNKNELNSKKESCFEYDLIKDKRYTVDKFQFHVPITINFKAVANVNINQMTNEYIRNCNDMHVIGIDRGERHLLYVSVIDMKGCIKEQFSLNVIGDEKTNLKTDYHHLLEKREQERQKARVSWDSIENIKELKEGYLSQVVHKISDLMIKYNAIVVLEDLNTEFMRGRQKVERSVYQKFEEKLINKLNFFASKTSDVASCGGLLKAYQLTGMFESFKKLGKQSGFLFYTQPWCTSKMDPVTGFVNLFDTRYSNLENAKRFFSNFDDIRYNTEKDWFEFKFDYKFFTSKASGSRMHWTLCTVGSRISTFRNPEKCNCWDNEEIVLTPNFKLLFESQGINIDENLKDSILKKGDANFFKKLLNLFKLMLQMRNSVSGEMRDYMQSPVADENGNFYNSESCGKSLPENADANGAYNIARKGLWIISQIKNTPTSEKLNLAISNQEWLQFAQEKPYLKQ